MNGISLIVTLEFLSSSPEYKKILSVMQAEAHRRSDHLDGPERQWQGSALLQPGERDARRRRNGGGGRRREGERLRELGER